MVEAWIVVRESAPAVPTAATTSRAAAPRGVPVTVGRQARVPLGVSVPDPAISRVALTVTAEPEGWTIVNTSRNGVVIQPWGLAPNRAAGSTQLLWPLVAIRVLGGDPDARHWVLLECAEYLSEATGPIEDRGTTVRATPPKPLTPAEREAIATVFESTLAWPPPASPTESLQLKQAARLLDVSASAVKVRLEGARAKAEALGLDRQVRVTDPEYVHVLVAAGYLRPPVPTDQSTDQPAGHPG